MLSRTRISAQRASNSYLCIASFSIFFMNTAAARFRSFVTKFMKLFEAIQRSLLQQDVVKLVRLGELLHESQGSVQEAFP
jgi:hypothetical protein